MSKSRADDAVIKQFAQEEVEIRKDIAGRFNGLTPCGTCETFGCCKQIVACSFPETHLILRNYVDVVNELWPRICEQAEREIDVAGTAVAIAYLNDRNRDPLDSPSRQISEDYFALNKPCAFFVGGKCAVYDVRPASCACQYLAEGDPRVCCEPGKPVNAPYLDLREIEVQIAKRCDAVSGYVGVSAFPVLQVNAYGVFPLCLAASIVYHVCAASENIESERLDSQAEKRLHSQATAYAESHDWVSRVGTWNGEPVRCEMKS